MITYNNNNNNNNFIFCQYDLAFLLIGDTLKL